MIHTYAVPGLGGGYSLGIPSLEGLKKFIQDLVTGWNYFGMSWTSFEAETPFNFNDLNGATCTMVSAGAGTVVGYQLARTSVSGQIFFRESNGKCMFATRDFFINVNTGGKDLQIGAGGAGVGGPLMLIK
jgi:hypothetical protein